MKREVEEDLHSWNNRIEGGDSGCDCSRHYKGIVHPGKYPFHTEHQIRVVVALLRSDHKGWPCIKLAVRTSRSKQRPYLDGKRSPISKVYSQSDPLH